MCICIRATSFTSQDSMGFQVCLRHGRLRGLRVVGVLCWGWIPHLRHCGKRLLYLLSCLFRGGRYDLTHFPFLVRPKSSPAEGVLMQPLSIPIA